MTEQEVRDAGEDFPVLKRRKVSGQLRAQAMRLRMARLVIIRVLQRRDGGDLPR